MPEALEHSPTFIDAFIATGTSCALINRRVYLLEEQPDRTSSKKYTSYFQHHSRRYGLWESEPLHHLEQDFFGEHRKVLERILEERMRPKQLHQERCREAILAVPALEQFLLLQVFRAYYHEKPISLCGGGVQEDSWRLTEQDILHLHPTLEECQQLGDILLFQGQSYALQKSVSSASTSSSLHVGSTLWILGNQRPASSFAVAYRTALVERVIRAKEKLTVRQKKTANQPLPQELLSCKNGQGSYRALTYRKTGPCDYRLELSIAPFIMEKNNTFYVLEGTIIGCDVHGENNTMTIQNPASVAGQSYKHPFVYSNGTICYHNEARWRFRDIQFGHPYSLAKSASLAARIAAVLEEGRMVLEHGYFGDNVRPVNSFLMFPSIPPGQLSAYLAQRKISLNRIFYQDGKKGL
ncbi:hypothetical protein HZB01_00560 [Candidatus Woesearchaeota archaeon]|nr:hypothetical protein [Candidatus Woesearchaeota archaeon]